MPHPICQRYSVPRCFYHLRGYREGELGHLGEYWGSTPWPTHAYVSRATMSLCKPTHAYVGVITRPQTKKPRPKKKPIPLILSPSRSTRHLPKHSQSPMNWSTNVNQNPIIMLCDTFVCHRIHLLRSSSCLKKPESIGVAMC